MPQGDVLSKAVAKNVRSSRRKQPQRRAKTPRHRPDDENQRGSPPRRVGKAKKARPSELEKKRVQIPDGVDEVEEVNVFTPLTPLQEAMEGQQESPPLLSLQATPPTNHAAPSSTGTSVKLMTRPPSKHGPDAPVVVFVNIVINAISSVDSASQTFEADFFLMQEWEDPRLQDEELFEWGNIWTPGLSVLNAKAVEEQYQGETKAMAFTLSARGKVRYEQRYTGSLTCVMDLRNFPFDHQMVSIQCVSSFFMSDTVELRFGQEADWDFEPHSNQKHFRAMVDNACAERSMILAEWAIEREWGDESCMDEAKLKRLFNAVGTNVRGQISLKKLLAEGEALGMLDIIPSSKKNNWRELFNMYDRTKDTEISFQEFQHHLTPPIRLSIEETAKHFMSDDTYWSHLEFTMKLQRHSNFYTWKVCSVLILIVFMAAPIFLLEAGNLEGRLNLILTLFLAAVAFNFVVMDALPKVGYLTWMDNFTFRSYVAIAVLVGESMVAFGLRHNQALADKLDNTCCAIFVIVYATYTIFSFWKGGKDANE